MATKKELESDWNSYQEALSRAQALIGDGNLKDALNAAKESWAFIDGMIKYERRFGDGEQVNLHALDVVLRLAPVLFDFPTLVEFETLLARCRAIERSTGTNYKTRLEECRKLMHAAHQIWSHLEANDAVTPAMISESLAVNCDIIQPILDTWTEMEAVTETESAGEIYVMLATKMNDQVSAKCSSCGGIAKAAKYKFLERQTCPKCRQESIFVLRQN